MKLLNAQAALMFCAGALLSLQPAARAQEPQASISPVAVSPFTGYYVGRAVRVQADGQRQEGDARVLVAEDGAVYGYFGFTTSGSLPPDTPFKGRIGSDGRGFFRTHFIDPATQLLIADPDSEKAALLIRSDYVVVGGLLGWRGDTLNFRADFLPPENNPPPVPATP